ncbi:unnamed protein product [Coffea canephora]|uniref:Methyltransferase type 11 domain-containing protein n=1 Tax=Coffea canephora TaxID=49390 RepID=A0A068UMN6_COFCA|nr:unnamed protein product [Coffea canephora]
MAERFVKQAKEYSASRPIYPEELFQFVASKTPCHDLVWDAGTGSGQAATSLARIYKNVVATDTSPTQLEHAVKLPNIKYHCTSPKMSIAELKQSIAAESSVDLVTIATAIHWFDLPSFYQQVKCVLKKPNGVIAAWSYTLPRINKNLDTLLTKLYYVGAAPFGGPPPKLIMEENYRTIDFPFEPVDGLENTGPLELKMEKLIDLDGYFTLIKSWSAYQAAKENGVELLGEDLVKDFTLAWNEDGKQEKIATWPVYMRIGKVGNQ